MELKQLLTGAVVVLLINIVIFAGVLVGGVWLVVKVLQWMGVL